MSKSLKRVTRCPRPFQSDRGADVWAACDLPEVYAPLITGTAGASPYLAGLIVADATWLREALDDPEAAVAGVLADVAALAADTLSPGLRQAKRRIALLTGLADLAGAWPLETVTQALTDLADAAVQQCIVTFVAQEIDRGKLPGATPDDAATGAGMVALAMGKMGAGELNYSSDIDLICLFDEVRFDPADYHDARASFIRVTRKMTSVLTDVTQGGYVFRTDLRLRPDASVTPVCLSMEAAERYYESVGRTWERAAYIKARAFAGDIAAGDRFLKTLTPFVWRKHLDFAAIEDAHDMRLKIRDHKGLGGPHALEGHNVKLGRGGIREIEFFTQTRQLIAGGRDQTLRVRETVRGLDRLAGAGWVPTEVATDLTAHYRAHREIEHRLQMINDAQTHELPTSEEGFARLAALMDLDVTPMRRQVQERLDAVHQLTDDFFAPDVAPDRAPDRWGEEITSRWPSYPALRSERASVIFERLRPVIMDKLAAAAKPEEALAQFDGFLRGLPAGVQLFSLFEANPQLTQLIADIAATSPALAQYLSSNASVFDAVIGGAFFDPWPGTAALVTLAREALVAAADYEAQLLALRRWAKEWHFRIGVHHLRGLCDAEAAARQYAELAQATLIALWPAVQAEFARKHGPPPGRGAVILGMGSLGAGQMNATSDLDLIMIYDPGANEASTGPRPLAVRPYYARLTQALVTGLSAQMAEGRLYEVDMRLRPSGRKGPVATSLASFATYQQEEAWTWEHLALTRARVITGPASVMDDVAQTIESVLETHADDDRILPDLADMRARLTEAKPNVSLWNAKDGPGRIQDIDLLAQSASLRCGGVATDTRAQITAGENTGWLTPQEAQTLHRTHALLWKVHASARLLTGGVFDPSTAGTGAIAMLLREVGMQTLDELKNETESMANAAAQVIVAKLPKGRG
ncbi:MAG: glutamine-synthetase adenylyltransferase [Pseudomonadota bacterium]